MRYVSTRGDAPALSFDDVLLTGLARDGGLYVPSAWPTLDIETMAGLTYGETACAVLKPFVGEAFDDAALAAMVERTYRPFRHPCAAPLREIGQDLWLMELFHGPTLAFKDYALQLLGQLFDAVLARRGDRVTVVGATSGDTGSAAIEACRDRDNVDIFILFPKGRVSPVQQRQMTTVAAANVHANAVEGSFDDCQNMVKALFNDLAYRDRLRLSAVNSINWARIVAQLVYYVHGAVALGAPSRRVAVSVPSGNFGNVYAAYGARACGLPIDRMIVGTNANDILHRFFQSGTMATAAVVPTISPSMDIQISSNFERLLFDLLDRDGARVRGTLASFRQGGRFSVTADQLDRARRDFVSDRLDDGGTRAVIAETYAASGILLDPHTAIGVSAARRAAVPKGMPVMALACAHPAKFPDAVEQATGVRPALPDHLADLFDRPERVTVLPNDQAQVAAFIEAHARVAEATA